MSDSLATVPPVIVRPPWPDEVPRIMAAFPRFAPQQAVYPLVALAQAPGGPERIVGFAGVFPPIRELSGLTLGFLPRFHAAAPVGAMIDAARGIARAAGARRLLTIDDRPPTAPMVSLLEGAGFQVKERTEFFSTELADISARVERVQSRLERAGRAGHLVPEPLAESHLPAVRDLIQAERLLEGEAITLAGARTGRGYSPRYSFVIHQDGQFAGAILARQVDAKTVAVEAEAVPLRWRRGPDLVHHALYRACIHAATAAGVERFVYTVNTAGGINTGRMARRTGSKLLRETVRLETRLG